MFLLPQNKLIILRGRFTFRFGYGHLDPKINYVCIIVLKLGSNHVHTIGFGGPASK